MDSHLSSGQSTAVNPCVHSKFYRSAEAEQKEKVRAICYSTLKLTEVRQPSCPHLRSTEVIFLIHATPLIQQSFLLCSNCASLLLLDIKKTDLEYMPVA